MYNRSVCLHSVNLTLVRAMYVFQNKLKCRLGLCVYLGVKYVWEFVSLGIDILILVIIILVYVLQ